MNEKYLVFKIPFYGKDEYIWEVYYKNGYYVVERPECIFQKTFFSGTLEQCKEFLRGEVIKYFGFPVNFLALG